MSARNDKANITNIPNINTSPRLRQSEDTSPHLNNSPGKNNNSNISQINSSSNEEENLMRTKRLNMERDATLTIPSPGIQQQLRLIKHDSDLNQDSRSSNGPSFRLNLAEVMESKLTDIILLSLILIYLGIVLVNVLLDHFTYVSSMAVLTGIMDLKFLEVSVLAIFIIEILIKLGTFGFVIYFRTWTDIFDTMLTFLIFALVIVGIVGDQSADPLNTYVGARGALRLFRVLFLTRKTGQFSRLSKSKVRPTVPGLKSNVEKVLELLNKLKSNVKDRTYDADIDWANEIIACNKLYEPMNDVANIKRMEKSGAGQWFKSFGNNYGKADKRRDSKVNARENGRRLSLLASGLNTKESGRNSTTIPKDVAERLEVEVNTFTFDTFLFKADVRENELVYTITFLFQRHNMFELLHIDQTVFTSFIKKVQIGYFDNPYHNYLHALDVLQTTNFFLTTGKYMEIADLSSIEVAAMYIAATIHDFEHPGTNNIFQMNTSSVYALRYNDKAILENHHVAACFELMKDPNLNILANLSKADYKTMRERIVAMVLATDMSQHFADIGKLKGRLATDLNMKEKDKNFTMEILVHAADISNPTKPWETCKEWTFRITQEFFNQGDKERDLKLPITALCDKYTTNIAKSQLGFIDFVVSPLYVLIKEVLPNIDISHLEMNKSKWKELVEHYDQELVKINEKKDKEGSENTQKVLG